MSLVRLSVQLHVFINFHLDAGVLLDRSRFDLLFEPELFIKSKNATGVDSRTR
jgi:hypothetical protein